MTLVGAGKQCDLAGPCVSNPCNSTNTRECQQDNNVFLTSNPSAGNFTCLCNEGGSLRADFVGQPSQPSHGCSVIHTGGVGGGRGKGVEGELWLLV